MNRSAGCLANDRCSDAVADVHSHLGAAAFGELWNAGRALPLEQLLAETLGPAGKRTDAGARMERVRPRPGDGIED